MRSVCTNSRRLPSGSVTVARPRQTPSSMANARIASRWPARSAAGSAGCAGAAEGAAAARRAKAAARNRCMVGLDADGLGVAGNCAACRAPKRRPRRAGSLPCGLIRVPGSRMQDKSNRRLLDVDIPAQPEVLVRLSLLLAEDEVDLGAASLLISSDMALAASVMKAVNSAMYGLRGRVQSVQQAITYLGTREVASVTFEMGLRAVFPAAPELEPLWQRARVRGLLMGRIGQALGVDPWAAHSAGIFEECGKAVMFRHATDRYRPMLEAAKDDEELLMLEHAEFGL